jgi:hypothetical protein
MTSHPLDAETALIAEWRAKAKSQRLTHAHLLGAFAGRDLDDCANDLESLLSTRLGSGSELITKEETKENARMDEPK